MPETLVSSSRWVRAMFLIIGILLVISMWALNRDIDRNYKLGTRVEQKVDDNQAMLCNHLRAEPPTSVLPKECK